MNSHSVITTHKVLSSSKPYGASRDAYLVPFTLHSLLKHKNRRGSQRVTWRTIVNVYIGKINSWTRSLFHFYLISLFTNITCIRIVLTSTVRKPKKWYVLSTLPSKTCRRKILVSSDFYTFPETLVIEHQPPIVNTPSVLLWWKFLSKSGFL